MQSIERGRVDRDASRIRAYARSERGAEETDALLEACRTRAREQGCERVTSAGDVGRALIGTPHSGLAALLDVAAGGGLDRLFVSHVGAFGWEPEQVHAVVDRLAGAGVVVETLREGLLSPQGAYLLAYGDLRQPSVGGGRGKSRRPR